MPSPRARSSAVHLATVTDGDHEDDEHSVVDFVDDAVVTNADSPLANRRQAAGLARRMEKFWSTTRIASAIASRTANGSIPMVVA